MVALRKNKNSMPTILLLFSVAFFFFVFIGHDIASTDYPWLAATGHYLINGGSFYTHNSFIFEDYPAVFQQWLYTVLLAVLEPLGYAGILLFFTLQLICLLSLCYAYFKLHGITSNRVCIAFSFILICVFPFYTFDIRPELITLVLLVAQILVQDYAIMRNKYAALFIIPLLLVLEMNLHSSMWIMHFLILFAYCFKCRLFRLSTSLTFDIRKPVIRRYLYITAFLMVSALFCTPYGFDAIKYLFSAFSDGSLDSFSIAELQPLALSFNYVTVLVLVTGLIITLLSFKKILYLSSFCVSVGLLVLVVLGGSSRLIQFLPIIYLFILSTCEPVITSINLKMFKIPVLVILILLLSLFSSLSVYTILSTPTISAFLSSCDNDSYTVATMLNYLEPDKSARIGTTFNSGGMFEYYGYSVSFDARPEMYTSPLKDGISPVMDYDNFIAAGNPTINKETGAVDLSVTKSDFEAYLRKYSFDYLAVPWYSIAALQLAESNDYTFLFGTDALLVFCTHTRYDTIVSNLASTNNSCDFVDLNDFNGPILKYITSVQ